jgi:hypothetical protein
MEEVMADVIVDMVTNMTAKEMTSGSPVWRPL